MKLVNDLLPVVIFFVVYQLADINAAVLSIMISMPVLLIITKLLKQEITNMQYWVTGLVLFFGGLTLAIDNPIFIKVKPTIVYIGAALALGIALILKKNPAEKMMGKALPQVPTLEWIGIAWQWLAFALFLAASNLYVAFMHTENTWVNFKTFFLPIATLIFVMIQMFFLLRKYDVGKANK